MSIDRREFLSKTAATSAAIAASSVVSPTVANEMFHLVDVDEESKKSPAEKDKTFVTNRIAVSTYSFFTFRDGSKLTIPECIDAAAKMGFDGVELLLVQMKDTSDSFLQKLKRRAFVNGLDLCGMSTHQGFVTPDKEKRDAQVNKTLGQIETAYKLCLLYTSPSPRDRG